MSGYAPIAAVAVLVGAVVSALHRPLPAVGDMYAPIFDGRLKDIQLFADAGNALLRGDIAQVYANPMNQAGPLQVVADAWIVNLAQYGAFPGSWYVVQAVIAALVLFIGGAGVCAALDASGVDLSRGVGRVAAIWGPYVGMVLLAIWNVPMFVYLSGHWWQLLVVAGWVAGGVLLVRGRPVAAGMVAAWGVLWEPWAVFGGFFVLWALRWRDAAWYVAASLLVGVAAWGVFVVQPTFAFTEYEWLVRPDSGWALLVEPESPFPWTARVVQTVLVAGVVTVAALMVRARGVLSPASGSWGPLWWSVWLSVVIVAARISTDVWFGQYYYAPVTVGILVLLAVTVAARFYIPSGLLIGAVVFTFTGSLPWGPFGAAAGVLVLVMAAGIVCSRDAVQTAAPIKALRGK